MTKDGAYQRGIEISLKYKTDAVVFKDDRNGEYDACALVGFFEDDGEIIAVFENGFLLE